MSSAQSIMLIISYSRFICHRFKVDQINYAVITFQYGNLYTHKKKINSLITFQINFLLMSDCW